MVLPEGLPAQRAVLAANMETAVKVVWDAGPTVGDRVVVIGAGVVGLLVAWLCRQIPETDVIAVDPNSARKEPAAALGVPWVASAPSDDGDGADLVVHASGAPAGLVSALAVAGPEAVVVEASWFGSVPVAVPLGENFHSRRLVLKSSQVGRVSPSRRIRWSTQRRLALALRLLRHPALDVLVTGECDFDALPEVMSTLSRDAGQTLCHRVRYAVSP